MLGSRHAFAACLQETWRLGAEEFEQDGYTFLSVAPLQQNRRGSQGVGVALSRTAATAWRAAGSPVWRQSPRAMGVRMLVRDPCKRKASLGVLLASGYAPVSSASDAEWDAYYADIDAVLSHAHPSDVVLFNTDANASIGRGSLGSSGDDAGRTGAVGPYGLDHINASGRRLRIFMETRALASLASFFRKAHYGTWLHPCSKRMHQLDHFIVSRRDVFRFTNAGSARFGQCIDSDHRAIECKLRIALGQHRKAPVSARGLLTGLDYSSLRGQEGLQARHAFSCDVVRHLGLPPPLPLDEGGVSRKEKRTLAIIRSPSSPLPPISLSSSYDDLQDDAWAVVEADYAAALAPLLTPRPISYSELADALQVTAQALLPKRPRRMPAWFAASAAHHEPLIDSRNAALNALHALPESVCCRTLLNDCRAKLKYAISTAKSTWILGKCAGVNDGVSGITGSKAAWDNVKLLRAGLAPSRRAAPAKMKKADGSLAQTAEENAEVFADAFEKLYGRVPKVDASVLDTLPQRPQIADLDHEPTDIEIDRALSKLHDTAPGDSGLPAALWKALGETAESFALVYEIVLDFWQSEIMPTEWETGILSILPKKGDLSLPGNYRGIMMLEVAYKIVANIILVRLNPTMDSLDHEAQCGFRRFRGCSDGVFTVKQMINKRREHGLETWVLFLDLVKAFDRVPRCAEHTLPRDATDPAEASADAELGMLWRVMLRYGVSPKLVRLLISMHKTVLVKFDVDGVVKTLGAIIGVKQGDLLGPPLFTFYICAIMESWRSEHSYELAVFRSRPDFKMTGRRSTTGGAADEFAVIDSEYADDTGLPFCSRADAEEQAPNVMSHFGRWGMEVHAGVTETETAPRKESKSEFLFCAAPPSSYTDPITFDGADLSDILLPGGLFMSVVDLFKYLGSYISRSGSDLPDVDARITSASKAFGALSACLFRSTSVSLAAKRTVYEGEILSILLYGSEAWLITSRMLQRLRVFHASCLRVMHGVTRTDTWKQRISTRSLAQELQLDSMDNYVYRRQLRWVGHVRRMPFDRLLGWRLPCEN